MTVKAVEIRAQLLRIRTRADRTADLTLNVPEDCTEQVKVLFGWLMEEVEAVLVQAPDKQETSEIGEVSTRAKRQSFRATT